MLSFVAQWPLLDRAGTTTPRLDEVVCLKGKLPKVCLVGTGQDNADVVWEPPQEDGAEENTGVMVVDEGEHLGHEGGGLVVTQLRHVQDVVGPLQVRRSERGNKAVLDCVVLVCRREGRDEVHHMCRLVLVKGGHNMVELGCILGDVVHSELGLRLSKPDVGPCLPELGNLESNGVGLVCHGGSGGLTLI